MNRLIFSLLVICGNLIAKANDDFLLAIWSKDGTKVSYALMDKPKITFTPNDLVIASNGVEVSYPISQLARFTYESASGIEKVANSDTLIRPFDVSGDILIFHTTSQSLSIEVFSIDGRLIGHHEVEANKTFSIPLDTFVEGIYIIRINGISYKISIK